MNRSAIMILCAVVFSACGGNKNTSGSTAPTGPTGPTVTKPAKWALDWGDEFNGTTVDPTNWIVNDGAPNVNHELEYYTPSDVYVENGSLVLRSEQRGLGGRSYTSGEVRTGTKHVVAAGSAVEWRTQIPTGKGIWPANWMVHSSCDGLGGCTAWPPEIDVMEIRGSAPNDNLMTHWWDTWPNQQHQTSEYTGATLSSGYHTYRLEWFPDSLLWYVDGVQAAKHTANITGGSLELVMNTAVGGDFDGAPDATTVFPQYHRIDYVRVYRDTANKY